MNSIKEITHAFIVRIWIEPRETRGAEPIWRGVIEHVEIEQAEHEKPVYFDHLDKMRSYFVKYLQKIGMKIDNH
jgi:hypothetical protein